MKVLLFGAGGLGKETYQNTCKAWEVLGFIDNDSEKVGTRFCGLPIYSLDEAPLSDADHIVISSSFETEIWRQLISKSLGHMVHRLADQCVPVECIPLLQNERLFHLLDEVERSNGSLIYDLNIYHGLLEHLRHYSPYKYHTFLHLGSGPSLGLEFLLSANEIFKNVVAFEPFCDDFDLLKPSVGYRKLFHRFEKYLGSFIGQPINNLGEVEALSPHAWRVGDSNVEVVSSSIFEENCLEDESVDVIFSNAVFEHVKSPFVTISECFRILRPGGVAIHQIDLRDHRDFSKPLDFLKIEENRWEEMMKATGGCYLNRWRSTDYLESFKQIGFEIEVFKSNLSIDVETVKEQIPSFIQRFREVSIEDHCTMSCLIVARKGGPLIQE